jgi:hypothetical protein
MVNVLLCYTFMIRLICSPVDNRGRHPSDLTNLVMIDGQYTSLLLFLSYLL